MGSVYGLLCLTDRYDNESIYIWNPVIGEYAIIPIPHKQVLQIYGFGFDHAANQYKVLVVDSRRIPWRRRNYNPTDKIVGQIYTLGSGEWRMLAHVPYSLHQNPSNVFINGSLHWMAKVDKGQGLNNAEFIVAFHLGREEFHIVPHPPGFNLSYCRSDTHTCHQTLWDLGGYLSIFYELSHHSCEIWVMKSYGVVSSWTKDYVISRGDLGPYDVDPAPISVMKNGNILMVDCQKVLFWYDPMKKSFSKIGRIDSPYHLYSIIHMGSLLSLEDIIRPTNGKHRVSSGWYRNLHLIPT